MLASLDDLHGEAAELSRLADSFIWPDVAFCSGRWFRIRGPVRLPSGYVPGDSDDMSSIRSALLSQAEQLIAGIADAGWQFSDSVVFTFRTEIDQPVLAVDGVVVLPSVQRTVIMEVDLEVFAR